MKLKFYSPICAVLCSLFFETGVQAQSGIQKNFSEFIDYAGFSLSAVDSSYVLAGSRWEGATFYDFCAVKLDKNGDMLWKKTFPSSSNEYMKSAFVTPSGEILLSGYRPDSTGDNDLSLMKISASGIPLWQKTYGTTNMEIAVFGGATPAGDIYLIGSRDLNERFCVTKTDASGNVIWTMAYGSPTGNEEILSATVTQDGGLLLMGTIPSYKSFLVKLRPDGSIAWANRYTSANIQFLSSVRNTQDGGYVITSADYRCDANGCHTYFAFMKLDSTGVVSWAKAVEGFLGEAKSVIETSDGFVFSGQLQELGKYNSAVIKTNKNGTLLWVRTYSTPGTSGEIYFSGEAYGGGFALAGTDNAVTSFFLADAMGGTGCNENSLTPAMSNLYFVKSVALTIPSVTETCDTEQPLCSEAAFALSDTLVCETLGIKDEYNSKNVLIYPNPTKEEFTVFSLQSAVCSLKLYDVFGKLVYEKNWTGPQQTLRHTLSQGVYFYKLFDGEKVIGAGKLIAE